MGGFRRRPSPSRSITAGQHPKTFTIFAEARQEFFARKQTSHSAA